MYLCISQNVGRETVNLLFLYNLKIRLLYYGFRTITFVLVDRSFWNFNTMTFEHRIKVKIDWGIVSLQILKQEALKFQKGSFLFCMWSIYCSFVFLNEFIRKISVWIYTMVLKYWPILQTHYEVIDILSFSCYFAIGLSER